MISPKNTIATIRNSRLFLPILAIVVCGSLGTVAFKLTHASTPVASVQAESGAVAGGGAAAVSDSTASGNAGVKFSVAGSGGRTCPAYPAFPDANCTGVPAGTTLTNYTGCSGGDAVISVSNTVIDSKTVNCNIVISGATGVIIKNSLITGSVSLDEAGTGSATITDSEIQHGAGTKNFTLLRVNVHGGVGPNFYCYTNCDIRDSWLHSPAFPQLGEGCTTTQQCLEAHLGAFLANDGPNGNTGVTLIHNRIHCDTPSSIYDGGCSGDVNLFGDFGKISHVTIDQNFLGASDMLSYCFYGGDSTAKPYPNADHVVFTNNIFQKGSGGCGAYGPVAGFGTDPVLNPGNTWTNNKFDDGTVVDASL